MAIRCPQCGKEYGENLLRFGGSVVCECGRILGGEGEEIWGQIRAILSEEEERNLGELQRLVDRVSSLIVATDLPEVDVWIEIEKVRERCRELFPDKMDLFDLVYESRFKRLWEQFRGETRL